MKRNPYDTMRAIASADLTRNEMKVLLAYFAEVDERTGKVRGKAQERIRALTGLCRSSFTKALHSLKTAGLISVQRHRRASATVVLSQPKSAHPRLPENTDIKSVQECREVRTSKTRLRLPGSADIDDIYRHGTELEGRHSVPTNGCCIAQGGEFSEGTSAGAAPDTDTRQGPFPAKGVVSHQGRTHSRERNIDGHEPTIEGTYAHDGRAGWEPLPCWEVAA